MIAIATSDWHGWHKPTPFREPEPDWYLAMKRPLDEIKGLQTKHQCPVLFAGDLFDRWYAPAEVISWFVKHMPTVYGIPGQHDLPEHRYSDVKRSAYWTLVEAGKVINVEPRKPYPCSDDLMLHAYPWGFDPGEMPPVHSHLIKGFNVALIHAYIWTKNHGYHDAPQPAKLTSWGGKLSPFKFAIFGDNHKGFLSEAGSTTVINCGALMRRRRDEADYKPRVYLLWSDGEVSRHDLDTKEDKVDTSSKAKDRPESDEDFDATEYIDALEGLEEAKIDFMDTLDKFMTKYGAADRVRGKVQRSVDAGRKR